MRTYFACSSLEGRYGDALRRCGVNHILASYAYKNTVLKALEFLKPLYPDNTLILDSGAFSAWSKGDEIDLNEYADFCLEFQEKAKGVINEVHVINLDVIPGEMGKNPTADQIGDSAEKGWANLERMEEKGVKPIHIFHQFEDFKWLDKLAKRQSYIGISPSNACSVSQRRSWLKHVFYSLKDNLVKTHGFGVTAKVLMEEFPWFSVDSTSWCAVEIYGRATFTSKKDQHETWFDSRVKSHRNHVIIREIKELQRLQKQNTDLWKQRGVEWT